MNDRPTASIDAATSDAASIEAATRPAASVDPAVLELGVVPGVPAHRAGGIDPLDIAIGRRVRRLRVARGLSQTELGRAADVTFQQIQKYETGTNRIAASTLVRLAAAFRVRPDALLCDDAAGLGVGPAGPGVDAAEGRSPPLAPGAEALLAGFARLGSEARRRAVLALIDEMNADQPAPTPVNPDLAAKRSSGA